MKRKLTLAFAAALAGSALTAQAQITPDGIVNASEIGTTAGKYTSLGAFTPTHINGFSFGIWGLLRMYAATSTSRFNVALAGTTQGTGNNFQLYMDLPGRSGVPAGTPLPSIAGATTVFGTFAGGSIGGTKMDMDVDAAIAMNGTGDVQAAVYTSATAAVAKSIGGGAAILTDGTLNLIPASETTGAYSLFAGTRVAYVAAPDLTTNPGNTNGGGAGSYALEYDFSRTSMGLPSGASIVRLMAAYVSGDAYWSADIIPEIAGITDNLGFSPDFTARAGTQAATVNVLVTSTRQAEEAVVAMSVFPNPAQGESTISYQVLGAPQAVTVRVTDLVGREVRTLLDAKQSAGFHDFKVGMNDLSTGIYLVKVQVGDKVATRRLEVTR